jgi:hypothetical protein
MCQVYYAFYSFENFLKLFRKKGLELWKPFFIPMMEYYWNHSLQLVALKLKIAHNLDPKLNYFYHLVFLSMLKTCDVNSNFNQFCLCVCVSFTLGFYSRVKLSTPGRKEVQ